MIYDSWYKICEYERYSTVSIPIFFFSFVPFFLFLCYALWWWLSHINVDICSLNWRDKEREGEFWCVFTLLYCFTRVGREARWSAYDLEEPSSLSYSYASGSSKIWAVLVSVCKTITTHHIPEAERFWVGNYIWIYYSCFPGPHFDCCTQSIKYLHYTICYGQTFRFPVFLRLHSGSIPTLWAWVCSIW